MTRSFKDVPSWRIRTALFVAVPAGLILIVFEELWAACKMIWLQWKVELKDARRVWKGEDW